jgi:hypothetical protein
MNHRGAEHVRERDDFVMSVCAAAVRPTIWRFLLGPTQRRSGHRVRKLTHLIFNSMPEALKSATLTLFDKIRNPGRARVFLTLLIFTITFDQKK